jgi:hypothetical protein
MQTFLPSVRYRTKCFYGMLLRQVHNLTRLSGAQQKADSAITNL